MRRARQHELSSAGVAVRKVSQLFGAISVSGTVLFAQGCFPEAKPFVSKFDPLALQQMQTRQFETSKEVLFASTMAVFQDKGFTIESADLATGFIYAKSPTSVAASRFDGITTGDTVEERASAVIESIEPGTAQARLNFVERRSIAMVGHGRPHDVPREGSSYYEEVFARIQEAVFLREANRGR